MASAASRTFGCLLTILSALLIGCGRSEGVVNSGVVNAAELFDATTKDLGGIRVNSDYEMTFVMKNTTSSPLVVTKILTSCGCVTTSVETAPLPPGGTRNITLALNTHGQSVMGPIVKHATVYFESGQKVELHLKAQLKSDFEIDPRRLEFSADQRTHRVALIRGQLEPEAFSQMVLVAHPDRYDVVEEASGNADRREFSVTMKEASAGAALPEIYFSDAADGRALPFATITCSRSGPTLQPSNIVIISDGKTFQTKTEKVTLLDFASQPMRITSVEGLDEPARKALRVTFDSNQDPKTFKVAPLEIPDGSFTNLFLVVQFAALDNSSTGRLLLPCHFVHTGAPAR